MLVSEVACCDHKELLQLLVQYKHLIKSTISKRTAMVNCELAVKYYSMQRDYVLK